ncbi:MAG TPA: glycosyltransferase family 39 protein [Solirubrobacteraceae bacterium]|jgi:4-amino-4-deoxy-L-arabinose transferase-like glycosyltransferase|nr:glycosyltransferase family 39 protein [Solirubrobacteraceae bacterium]
MNATYFPHRRTEVPLSAAASAAGARASSRAEERSEPTWARPALIALLVCTAVAYLWDLSASGYANSFYAAAVQAGTNSWKAMFFGSIDSSNFITVDKPPASMWVMELSGRIFGFSSSSMLVPQVLEGVAAVAMLHAAVKRWFGARAGLAAGALLAITPVAALMFRFNNPDALLVCLLVAGAYCLVRAVEGASTRWVIAAGTMIGFAFLAKMMQAFLVLPAFGLVYMVAAPTTLRRRLWQLLAGAAAIVASCGWWVAIVALWPVSSRPMIDGSPDNNIFNLIFGYNGLGRIFGASGPGGGGGGANFSGPTGLLRLFDGEMGAQASWLLPAAVLALIAGLWLSRRAPRTDRTRAALLLWGGWLLVSAVVFSFGSGVIHTYYTVALVPAIAALVAIGGVLLWRQRHTLFARAVAALAVALTASWSWVLLDRTPQWESWTRVLVPASAAIAVVGLLAAPVLRRFGRQASIVTAVLAVVACLSGPVAYSAQTITTAHTGSIPSAGPGSNVGGGPGGAPGARTAGAAGGPGAYGAPGAGGCPGGASGARPESPSAAGSPPAGGIRGGAGGQANVSTALKHALESDAGKFRWVAAVSGSQSAASLELATGGEPVMAIGGFNNEGGNLTLAEFKRYVAAGDIHYYFASSGMGGAPGGGSSARLGVTKGSRPGAIAGAGPGGGGGAPSTSSITSWVEAHFKSVKIGGQTVYDLMQARS